MKSLERRHINIQKRNPYLSSYINFAKALTGQNFTQRSIQFWFNKLVDKDDYFQKDKKDIITHLEKLNKPIEDNIK